MTTGYYNSRNGVDQHEMPSLAASHHGLHCCLKPPFSRDAVLKSMHAKLFVVAIDVMFWSEV